MKSRIAFVIVLALAGCGKESPPPKDTSAQAAANSTCGGLQKSAWEFMQYTVEFDSSCRILVDSVASGLYSAKAGSVSLFQIMVKGPIPTGTYNCRTEASRLRCLSSTNEIILE